MSLSENIFNYGENKIYYSVEKSFYRGEIELRAVVDGIEGNETILSIPNEIVCDDKILPVRVIGKKAFLGNVSMTEAILPKSVILIDNWAFAQCDNLKKVTIHRERVCHELSQEISIPKMDGLTFGKAVFSDSKNLRHICLGDDKENSLSALLATIFSLLDAEHLIKDINIGKKEWFYKWDCEFLKYLHQDDTEGSHSQMLGGEEDINKNVSSYISEKKKNKARLCFVRLMNRDYLSSDVEQKLSAYLKNHTKGCEYETGWQVILEEHSDELPFYQILHSVGGITPTNLEQILQDLGEHHLEAKSYLIALNTREETDRGVFQGLILD